MTKHKHKLLVGAILSAIGCLTMANQTWATPANPAFKDDKFYSCVYQSWNTYGRKEDEPIATKDTNLTDTQLAATTKLFCDSAVFDGITDVSGFEKLTGLEEAQIHNGSFSTIDLSKSTSLTILDLISDALTSIDVSKNTKLKILNLYDNKLTSINLSSNTALETLVLSKNNLTELDLSKNTALNWIYVYDNNLSSLDLSNLPSYQSGWGDRNSIGTPGHVYADDIFVTVGLKAIQFGDVFYADTDGVGITFGFDYDESKARSKVEETASVKNYISPNCPIKSFSSTGSCIAIANLNSYPGYVQLTSLNRDTFASEDYGMDSNKLTMKLQIVPIEEDNPSSSDPSNSDIKVPNTGLFAGESAGTITLISIGIISAIALVLFVTNYSKKRLSNQVKFNNEK